MAEVAASIDELYPDLRGEPMENTQQYWTMLTFSDILRQHYKERTDAYVGGDTLIYYALGDPSKRIVPDVYVLFGVPGLGAMGSYRVWEIGKAPDFVLEVASPSTKRKDRVAKPFSYAQMGVREYWRFDPEARRTAPLAGYQLGDQGAYDAIPVRLKPNGVVAAPSDVLGLTMEAERFQPGVQPEFGTWGLYLRDPITEQRLRDHAEDSARADAAEAQRDTAEKQRDAQRDRADAAEGQRDAERDRADAERDRADSERDRADAAEGQRDSERDRADAAEAEVRAMKAALGTASGASSS